MTNEILEQLELVDVIFEDNKKVTLVFLHEERGEIREVNFNKQVYDKVTKSLLTMLKKRKRLKNGLKNILGLNLTD